MKEVYFIKIQPFHSVRNKALKITICNSIGKNPVLFIYHNYSFLSDAKMALQFGYLHF